MEGDKFTDAVSIMTGDLHLKSCMMHVGSALWIVGAKGTLGRILKRSMLFCSSPEITSYHNHSLITVLDDIFVDSIRTSTSFLDILGQLLRMSHVFLVKFILTCNGFYKHQEKNYPNAYRL